MLTLWAGPRPHGPSVAGHAAALAAGALLAVTPVAVLVTSPAGRRLLHACAVTLATGARERSRAARLIPGDRPAGVYTTGQLQNLVHLRHAEVGRRAVVGGGELVSWSAVLSLRPAGCAVVLMTTTYPARQVHAAFRLAGRLALRVPVAPRARVARIAGRRRVVCVWEPAARGRRRD